MCQFDQLYKIGGEKILNVSDTSSFNEVCLPLPIVMKIIKIIEMLCLAEIFHNTPTHLYFKITIYAKNSVSHQTSNLTFFSCIKYLKFKQKRIFLQGNSSAEVIHSHVKIVSIQEILKMMLIAIMLVTMISLEMLSWATRTVYTRRCINHQLKMNFLCVW